MEAEDENRAWADNINAAEQWFPKSTFDLSRKVVMSRSLDQRACRLRYSHSVRKLAAHALLEAGKMKAGISPAEQDRASVESARPPRRLAKESSGSHPRGSVLKSHHSVRSPTTTSAVAGGKSEARLAKEQLLFQDPVNTFFEIAARTTPTQP